ncbi:hypothetical protein [Paraburkholderia sp. BL10I2N1]|nr:hypothetical protein [Paraburkholderia sp. BL10I2N1]
MKWRPESIESFAANGKYTWTASAAVSVTYEVKPELDARISI